VLARRALAGDACNLRGFGLGCVLRGAPFVLGGLQLFEIKLHLVEQTRRALRPRAVDGALQFLNLQRNSQAVQKLKK
jgi:hypothetical protein